MSKTAVLPLTVYNLMSP